MRGTLVVEEALRDVQLRCFVLFSSVSSIVPSAGQVDYAAANAFLDAYALSCKDPVTVINWGAWRNVGMAARSNSPHLLLQERLLDTPLEVVYQSELSQARQWVLSEHVLQAGHELKALFPGTGYLEMAAAAFLRGPGRGAVEFRDVFFLVPLMLDADESREVRVQLRRDQQGPPLGGPYRFSVSSRTTEWIEHSFGTVARFTSRATSPVDRAVIAARCLEREIVFDEKARTLQERYLTFGPRWRPLRRLLIGAHEALAEIELDEKFSEDISSFRLHPAMLDLATGASFYLTDDCEHSKYLFLPISYKKMHVFPPLPAKLFSHIRSRRQSPRRNEVETFDITLFDERGQVLVEIEGFSARRIADPLKTLEECALAESGVHVGGERPIEVLHRSGLESAEGARALVRILSAATPRAVIAVSEPLDLSKGIYPISAARAPSAATPKTPLSGETVESTLAAWWQEILGVDPVGPGDDFFNLGGHFLVGGSTSRQGEEDLSGRPRFWCALRSAHCEPSGRCYSQTAIAGRRCEVVVK